MLLKPPMLFRRASLDRDARAVFCLFPRFEAVFEQHAAVEDEVVCLAVLRVQAEVAHAHELIARSRMRCAAIALFIVFLRLGNQRRLDLAAGQDRERLRVHALQEVLIRAVGLRVQEQVVVQANLCVDAGFRVCFFSLSYYFGFSGLTA